MLENYNVLLIGGDKRYIEIVNGLSSKRARISLLGFDNAKFGEPNVEHVNQSTVNLSSIDAIILPVSGTNDSGEVVATYANEPTFITKEIVEQTPEHCVIYSGISTPYLEKLSEKTDRKLVCIFERDDLAILNSIPTAEGALQLALENTDYTVHGANVFVLGFGRIGVTIARLFSNVGANVTVAVRKAADVARIIEMGKEPIQIREIEQHIDRADIIINTVGFPILNSDVISNMRLDSLVIDLASDPGGTDFKYAKEKGITALHALGLPGKVAPRTAGKVMARVLIELFLGMEKPN